MTGSGCGWSKISRVRAPYDNLDPAVKPLQSPESAVYIMDSLLGGQWGFKNSRIPHFSRLSWLLGTTKWAEVELSLGVEVGVVAVEPVNTAVRFQVGLVKNPPDRRPTHGQVMSSPVDQGGSEVIQRPTGGGTTLLCGGAARQIDQIEPLRGGKIVAVVPTAARPGGQPIRLRGSGCATPRRCGDYSRTGQRFEGWWDGPCRRHEESAGIERPRPGEWSLLEPSFPIERAEDPLARRFPRMGKA